MITENQIKEYNFKTLPDGRLILYAGYFEFIFYPDSNIMRMGMEERNGWHEVKNFDEFETLYSILYN